MNYFKTAMLLAGLTALFCGAGYMLGGEQGMTIALLMAMGTNIFAYWFSDKMVLKMYGAQPIESGYIYDIVAEVAGEAELPMPKVYSVDTDQPNAFATGRSPRAAAVAVTRGIAELLDRRELRGVIAHELAHVKNRDTLIMTITATIAGALSMLGHFAMFTGGRRDQEGNGGRGIIGMIFAMVVAPFAAMLVQMAISRTREYAADRIGSEISHDPAALASALAKIEEAAHRVPNAPAERNPATAHLFIINPLSMRRMDNLFSTHPNTANRIRLLEDMARGTEETTHGAHPNPWGQ